MTQRALNWVTIIGVGLALLICAGRILFEFVTVTNALFHA